MKLTKERKIYAGLFVVAACALIGDQVFSGPRSAAAASVDETLVVSPAVRTASAAPLSANAEHTAVTVQLAQKLRTLEHDQVLNASPLSDPFKLPESWDKHADAQSSQSDIRVASFKQRHRVTALMVRGTGGGSALVDGQFVRVGQSVDGFKLVEVTTRSAVFECGKQTARLIMTDK